MTGKLAVVYVCAWAIDFCPFYDFDTNVFDFGFVPTVCILCFPLFYLHFVALNSNFFTLIIVIHSIHTGTSIRHYTGTLYYKKIYNIPLYFPLCQYSLKEYVCIGSFVCVWEREIPIMPSYIS